MGSNGRDEGRDRRELRLIAEGEHRGADKHTEAGNTDVVFDFTDVQHPGFSELSLILTARLRAAPHDRVWVRAIPEHTWHILRALGLDHLFRHYPGPENEPN